MLLMRIPVFCIIIFLSFAQETHAFIGVAISLGSLAYKAAMLIKKRREAKKRAKAEAARLAAEQKAEKEEEEKEKAEKEKQEKEGEGDSSTPSTTTSDTPSTNTASTPTSSSPTVKTRSSSSMTSTPSTPSKPQKKEPPCTSSPPPRTSTPTPPKAIASVSGPRFRISIPVGIDLVGRSGNVGNCPYPSTLPYSHAPTNAPVLLPLVRPSSSSSQPTVYIIRQQ